MATALTLKVYKGSSFIGTREFNLDIIRIGRLSAANLCLDDAKVSRVHSVIDTSNDAAVSILDMGSPEGTWVNGKRISKGVLAAGDEIRLGDTRLIVGLAPQPAPAEEVRANAEPQRPPDGGVEGSPRDPSEALDAAVAAASASVRDLGAPEATVETVEVAEEGRPAVVSVIAPIAPTAEPVVAAPSPELQAAVRMRPAAEAASGAHGVEVRFFWGESLIGSVFRDRPGQIVIGSSPRCDFHLPDQGLPGDEFPIVELSGGKSHLTFSTTMDGEVEAPGAPPRRLRELAPEAASHAGLRDCLVVPLPPGAFAWLQLATFRIEVAIKPPPRLARVPFWQAVDYRWLNVLLVIAIAMLGFIVTAATMPLDTDTTADDLFRNPAAMAKFIVHPPSKTKNALADKLKKESDKLAKEAAKHKEKEGKMGRRDAPTRNTRSAPKAIDANAQDVVKNSGLMRLLGGGGGGLATILGAGGLGGDLKGAIGHMFGPGIGDAGGLGGLGLRGTGAGGGGFGSTIGVGEIGTKGRGGGLGAYGLGVGAMGMKRGSDIPISGGNPVVEGSIDKELIRRVIHQHRSQIRFCYESELVRHPGMNGKVTVRFIIGATGAIRRANVETSTLGNATVENCIVSRVYQWQFPRPKGGGIVVVNYPFLFKEAGD